MKRTSLYSVLGAAWFAFSPVAMADSPGSCELPSRVEGEREPGLDAPAAMFTFPNGLRYLEEVLGEGPEARLGREVTFHYVGCLEDGTRFDSSFDRGGALSLPLAGGSKPVGLYQSIRGMRVGGRRRIFVPPALAYGQRGAGEVPGDTAVTFVVELLDVR